MDEFNIKNNKDRFVADRNEYIFDVTNGYDSLTDEIKSKKKQMISDGMKRYMSIGSVVKISRINQLLMIIGFNYKYNQKVYDYIGCYYPFGLDGEHRTLSFNHDQIIEVYHIGYINASERSFKEELDVMYSKNEITK